MIRRPALAFAFLVILNAGAVALSQESPSATHNHLEIEHSPAPCMDTEVFPLIEARASSANVARALTGLAIRFKAEDDDGWYETSFRSPAGATFQAALPKPQPEAARVVYYFTVGERTTQEYRVPVLIGGCPGARNAAPGLTDGIRVRRTAEGQTEIPTGFSADGISAGGSMSGMTPGVVGAAAGGAAVAALAISGGEDLPPTNGGGNPGNPEAIRACFTPDPIPDINSGNTILFDASCTTPPTVTTYRWDFGDGTTAQGSNVEHLFTPGGVYTVSLTASDASRSDTTSRLVQVIATPSACFTTNPDPPRIGSNESINFNAECSAGDRDGGEIAITRYEWDFGDGRPGAEGVFVSRQFPRPDVYGVRLTITNSDGRQGTNTQFVVVETPAAGSTTQSLRASDVTVSVLSALEFPQGGDPVRAQLSVNDSATVTTTATQQLRLRARIGDNVLEGRLLSAAGGTGRWRLDFTGTPDFVAGSLRVDNGELLARDAHTVVFRMSGKTGPFVRVRFSIHE